MFNFSNCNFFGVDYSPQLMFPVKDVIHPSRVAAILFPLHPARMLHILFFTLGGSLSAWWFLGIRNEEDGYFTKVSEKYVDWAMFEQKNIGRVLELLDCLDCVACLALV